MDITTGRDAFVNFTPADFYSSGHTEHMQQEETEGGDHQRGNHAPVDTPTDLANFETVKRVLQVLKEGEMDVAGFLDALCWGNRLAVADPTTRAHTMPTTSVEQSTRISPVRKHSITSFFADGPRLAWRTSTVCAREVGG